MAFRGFVGLRGHPTTCYSGCGTIYKGKQEYLKEIMQEWNIRRIKNVLEEDFDCQFEWERMFHEKAT